MAHLNAVADTPEWRQAFNDNLGSVIAFRTAVAQHRGLAAQYRALASSLGFSDWSPARRRVVELQLRHFRLSGADLDDAGQARFAQNQGRLGELAARFGQNVQDATDAYQLYLPDASRLAGVPAADLAQFAEAARKAGKAGYLVTLQAPSFVAVVQHADDRTLREEVYRAYAQRASEFGPPEWDNTPVIREWLTLVDDQARLLGFGCHAEVSVATKMVDTPAQAIAFLRDLAARARPFADRDRVELRAWGRTLGLDTVEAWDRSWLSEKLRQSQYAFSSEEVRAHLAHDDVVTLFHEFGHALQQTLTRVDEIQVAGIANVEWDAVELPSQLMENFCWLQDLLPPLPPALFQKMLAAKNFQSGLATVRQVELGLLDLLLYSEMDPRSGDWLELLRAVRAEVGADQPPEWNRFPNASSTRSSPSGLPGLRPKRSGPPEAPKCCS